MKRWKEARERFPTPMKAWEEIVRLTQELESRESVPPEVIKEAAMNTEAQRLRRLLATAQKQLTKLRQTASNERNLRLKAEEDLRTVENQLRMTYVPGKIRLGRAPDRKRGSDAAER